MSEEDFRVLFPENKSFFSFYTFKKVMQWVFLLLICAFIGFMILRSCTSKGSDEMKEYLWTPDAFGAYESEDFQVYEIPASNRMTVTSTFAVSHIYYTEPTGEMQFLLSYNLSKLEEWGEHFGMSEMPERGEELFAFVLEDDEGNIYTDYTYVTDTQLRNGFYRLIFSGVKMTNTVFTGATVPDESGETQAITAIVPIDKLTLNVYHISDTAYAGEKIDEVQIYAYGVYKQKIDPTLPEAPREGLKEYRKEETK